MSENRAGDASGLRPASESHGRDVLCERCGVLNRAASSFCRACGSPLCPSWQLDRSEVFRRPVAVSAMAVWFAIGGACLLVAAFAVFAAAETALKPALVLVLGALAGVHFLAARDLWQLRPAGRIEAIVLAILGLVAVPIGTVVGIVAVAYLLYGPVRLVFSGRQPEEHSSGELAALHRMAVGRRGETAAVVAVVAAILLLTIPMTGMVAAIAIPNYINAAERARVHQTMLAMHAIAARIEICRTESGRLPEGLDAPGGLARLLDERSYGSQLEDTDAWARPFEVTVDGEDYRLVSYGRDGQEDDPDDVAQGRVDFDTDIVMANGRFVSWPRSVVATPDELFR